MAEETFQRIFVDREKEIRILEEAMRKAREGNGSIVLITGEIGVGKTTLAEKFAEVCQNEGFVVLSSLCIGELQPAYHPILSALQNYAKRAQQSGDLYIPLGLASFQSYEVDEKSPESFSRERTRFLEHLLRQFIEIAKQKPLVFIIDDLHLADSATLAFFHYLARNIKNERIVGVATAVVGESQTNKLFTETLRNMNIERLLTHIKLENLKEKDILAIVESKDFPMPKEIAAYIHERTSGNPLFVVEFLAAIQNSGLKDIEAIKKLSLPRTIKEIVRFRISKLDEKARKVLTACAILGRVFEYSVLVELLGVREEELLEPLETLLSQNLLVEAKEYEEGYKFVSTTIHEVAYESISSVRKKLLHQRAGEIIEKHHGSDEKFWSTLAWHYREANNAQKFLEYAIKAGRNAASKYANAEAIGFFRAVLETLNAFPEEISKKVEVLWELADVLEIEGRYEEAIENLMEIQKLTGFGNAVEAVRIYRKCAEIYIIRGEYEKAQEMIEKAQKILNNIPDATSELGMLFSVRGYLFERIGKYEHALREQERAIAIFKDMNMEKELAKAYNRAGIVYWYLGDFEKAQEVFSKSFEIREKIGDLRGLAISYNNLGITYRDRGNIQLSVEYFTKSLMLSEKIGDIWGIAVASNNIGSIYHDRSEYPKALEFYKKSLELRRKIGDASGFVITAANLGAIHTETGEYEKAIEFFKESIEAGERIGYAWGVALAYSDLGEVYLDKCESEKAIEYFTKSIEICRRIGERALLCRNLISMGEALLQKGDIENCVTNFSEAKKIAEELGQTPLDANLLRLSAKILVAEGKLSEAETELKKALEVYEKMDILGIEYYITLYELGKIERNREILERALRFFEKIGNSTWRDRVRKELQS